MTETLEKRFMENKGNYIFERSSGYAGYRNVLTNEWIYEEDYFKLFSAEEKLYTKEQIINTMHQVELEDDKDYSKLFYRVIQKINEL